MDIPLLAVITKSTFLISLLFFTAFCLMKARRGAGARESAAIGILFVLFCSYSLLYLISNQFTENGINEAVLYHLRVGLAGAGFSDFKILIFWSLTFLFATLALAFVLAKKIRSHNNRLPAKGSGTWAYLFLVLALLVHPASHDLFRIAGIFPSKGNDEFSHWFHSPHLPAEKTSAPGRDLIWIYLESVEHTYFDQQIFPGLIKQMRNLEQQGTSFTNLDMIDGSQWTIGGMVASQCGIPMITPSWGDSMGAMSRFLSGATCIGDLLHQEGYLLSYMGGANLNFAGKGKFYRSHGFTRVQGSRTLMPHVPGQDYHNAWGLFDDSLYAQALQEFQILSQQKKPFALFLLTLDTHHPHGHASRSCNDSPYHHGDNPMLDAVHCADKLVANFIRKIRQTERGKNTVIVITSDHLAQHNLASAMLARGRRTELFILLDPKHPDGGLDTRHGTVLDIGPTVLHALDYRTAIGLGRDLLDPKQVPLVDRITDFEKQLAAWRPEFLSFWDFPRLDSKMRITVNNRGIVLNDQQYQAPLLMTWDTSGQTTFYFNDPFGPKVFDYVLQLNDDTPFLWLDQCSAMKPFATVSREDGFCLSYGKLGTDPKALPLRQKQVISQSFLQHLAGIPAAPNSFFREKRAVLEKRLRPEVRMLLQVVPDNSLVYINDPHQDKTLRLYFRDPRIKKRNIRYINKVPRKKPFFLVSSDISYEQKRLPGYQLHLVYTGQSLKNFLTRHSRDLMILAVKDEATRALHQETKRFMASSLGLAIDKLAYRGSFAAVLRDRKTIAQKVCNGCMVTLQSTLLAQLGIDKVVSGGADAGNRAEIYYHGKNYSPNRRGFNIVTVDEKGRVKATSFDTFLHEWKGYAIVKAVPSDDRFLAQHPH